MSGDREKKDASAASAEYLIQGTKLNLASSSTHEASAERVSTLSSVKLSCPFCGSADTIADAVAEASSVGYHVTCRKCGARGPVVSGQFYWSCENEALAYAEWNQRISFPTRKNVEAIKASLLTGDALVFDLNYYCSPLNWVLINPETGERWGVPAKSKDLLDVRNNKRVEYILDALSASKLKRRP